MGFFSKVKKFALPAIGALIAGPAGLGLSIGAAGGAAIGSGIASYTSNHDPLAALLSAGGSYVGSQIGGNLLPETVGNVVFDNLPAGEISNYAMNSLPSSIANASIGSIIGSSVGSDLASNAVADNTPKPQTPSGPDPFVAKQQAEKQLPNNLASSLGSLTPQQQSSNLATQGVYGGGLSPSEQEYYVNQAQRRLVDPSGDVADPSQIYSPIEQSYLQRLGLGGYTSGLNLAELISQWKPA